MCYIALTLQNAQNHMLTYGNYAMVFVIYNQSFLILGITFFYNFLLDVMTRNTSHSLRFKIIYNNNMVINFLKCAHTCCSIPSEPKFLVVLQFHKQFFIACLLFNL